MPRQHPQRRDQNSLRLFHAHRPPAPALPHRPLADGALETDDVPDTAAGGTAEPAERIKRLPDTTAGIQLRLGKAELTR